MDELLPPGSWRRTAVLGALAFGLLLLFTQVLVAVGSADPTPAGILFFGGTLGVVNALTAAGIVLIYRTTRIINFAQSAIGGAGGIFAYNLVTLVGWPFFAGVAVGIIVAALVGLTIELVFVRRFFEAPRLVLTVFTLALFGALGALVGFVSGLPIFGDVRDRTLAEQFGQEPVPVPFDDFTFRIGDLSLPFGFEHLFAIGIAAAALLGVGYFLRYTRAGIAVRASAENADRASLLGIPVRRLSSIVWTIAGALSGVSVIALGTMTNFTAASGGATSLLIRALAGAVLGRMRSIPVAVAATIGIEVAAQSFQWGYSQQPELIDAGLLVVIVVGLLLQRRERRRSDEAEESSWEATEEVRATPRELLEIGAIRTWRYALVGVGLLAILLLPWVTSTGVTNEAGVIVITTIVILSLVVLTGWTGQISLGQYAFLAVAAVVGGALTSEVGVPFWVALVVVPFMTAAFTTLIGVPALRIRGFFLGVTTYAFAFATQSVLFKDEYFGWLVPDQVERPTLFLLDFEDERSMYYLTVAGLVISVVLVVAIRRTRSGRVLIGLRENETNLQAFGVNLLRTRLAGFALSGFLVGIAGVLFAHHQRAVAAEAFTAGQSVTVFILAVLGGVGSISGALIGGAFFGAQSLVQSFSGPVGAILQFLLGPFGRLAILYVAPGGLVSVFFGLRDSVLRIVAQRRQLVVPSLFADVDPEALERRLIPLSDPQPDSGLSALPFEHRYRTTSVLYRVGAVGDGERRRREEAETLATAAERATEETTTPGEA